MGDPAGSGDLLTIGELAAETGVATSALRYYEELALLAPVERVSGQRRYDRSAVGVVGAILLFRDLGFTLAEIAQLVEPRSEAPQAWRELAARKIDELERQILDAEAARTALDHALHCPKDHLLSCPNFWSGVGQRLEGRRLTEMVEQSSE
jgi:MerR family redox-sensitive transcriptional activator SoxR